MYYTNVYLYLTFKTNKMKTQKLNQAAKIYWTGRKELTLVTFVKWESEANGEIQVKLQGSDKFIWVKAFQLQN